MSDMDFPTGRTVVSGSSYDSATVGNGAIVSAISGGVLSNVTVENGGMLYLNDQGVVGGGTVEAGGTLVLNSGGTVENVTFEAGGKTFSIAKGGVASGLIMNVEEDVYGLDSGTTVHEGVQYTVEVGGSGVDTTLQDATADVSGTAINATVIGGGANGGTEGSLTIHDGGVASGTVVTNYGKLVVSSGGVASGVTLETACRWIRREPLYRMSLLAVALP